MWRYEKRLQYPVNIKEPNAKLAQFIISQYGGPDGGRRCWKTAASKTWRRLKIPAFKNSGYPSALLRFFSRQ